MGCGLFTLDKGEVGKRYVVLGLIRLLDQEGAAWEVVGRRLSALGVNKGETLDLVSKLTANGPFIISSMGTLIGISKTFAQAVRVEEARRP